MTEDVSASSSDSFDYAALVKLNDFIVVMLYDQHVPKPLSVRLDVMINPLFASGSERAEQEDCALLLSSNTHQRDRAKEKPPASAANGLGGDSRYELPRHIQPIAADGTLSLHRQVAGSE